MPFGGDREAFYHDRMADEVFCKGPSSTEESKARMQCGHVCVHRVLDEAGGIAVVTAYGAGHGLSEWSLPDASARTDQRVHVEVEGHDYQLVVSGVPDPAGCMYVRFLTVGPRRLALVASLKVVGVHGWAR